jgi:mono/diheme cytochrome c family protein
VDFAQLLAAASQALNAPEAIVGRSARARATALGVAPEQVLAEWAGVDAGAVAAAPAAAPAPEAAPAPAAAAPAAPGLDVEVVSPEAKAEPERKIAPEPEPEPEPEEEPEEVVIGSAGIRTLRRKSLPRWLAATFLVVPLFALFYAATFASGPGCGNGGALAVDPVTGVAENCDGSEFGSVGGNPLRLGAALYAAEAAPTCQSCHGADGGGGTGPAFAGGAVIETFPACADHILWVTLGTNRWRDEVGNTYGATNKPVGGGGVMQAYEDGLTPEEIAAVVLFERVTFGGLDPVEAEADCFPEEDAEASP